MANISNFPGFEKIGSFVINLTNSNTLWNFIKDNPSDKRIGSHTYLIVVNNLVKKLGCSVTKLNNCAGYGVGNGGSPSDRTTGIHYFIAKELNEGNIVEFYAKMCPKIDKIEINDIFNNTSIIKNAYIEPKQMEQHYLNSFKEKFSILPEWNMQEQGRSSDWPENIKTIRNALCQKKIIEYKPEHNKCQYMMLYHNKYNKELISKINSV